MRLLAFIAILILTGCSSLDQGGPVFIGKLEWVKLRPKELPQSSKLENGLEGIVVSNSCGTAEVKYQTTDSEDRLVWMHMGEWCKTPFDTHSSSHLVIVSQNNEIIEYHAIEEDEEKESVIFLLDGGGKDNVHLGHLLKNINSPVFLEDLNEGNSAWAEMMSAEGIVKIENNRIYILKAVYVSDVISEYKL